MLEEIKDQFHVSVNNCDWNESGQILGQKLGSKNNYTNTVRENRNLILYMLLIHWNDNLPFIKSSGYRLAFILTILESVSLTGLYDTSDRIIKVITLLHIFSFCNKQWTTFYPPVESYW